MLIVLALAAHAALGPRRALARSALWNACLVGLLLLPVCQLVFPRIRVTVPLETRDSRSRMRRASPMVRSSSSPFPASTGSHRIGADRVSTARDRRGTRRSRRPDTGPDRG